MQVSVGVATASGSATDRPPWPVVKTPNDRGSQARSRNPSPTGIRIVLPTGGPFYRIVFVFASQVRSAGITVGSQPEPAPCRFAAPLEKAKRELKTGSPGKLLEAFGRGKGRKEREEGRQSPHDLETKDGLCRHGSLLPQRRDDIASRGQPLLPIFIFQSYLLFTFSGK